MNDPRTIRWRDFNFINQREISILQHVLPASLITVPSAPVLVENYSNPYYNDAVRSSDFSIIDSSLLALLCRLYKIRVHRYSGFRLLLDLLDYLRANHLRVFLVNPNEKAGMANRHYLLSNTCLSEEEVGSYVAPLYPWRAPIEDSVLLRSINEFKPDLVILGIAGGKQEVLGDYLRRNVHHKTTIICTGAALSFFTGEQARITGAIDKYYLGWLARIFRSPSHFLPRYLNAARFIFLFFRHRLRIIR